MGRTWTSGVSGIVYCCAKVDNGDKSSGIMTGVLLLDVVIVVAVLLVIFNGEVDTALLGKF